MNVNMKVKHWWAPIGKNSSRLCIWLNSISACLISMIGSEFNFCYKKILLISFICTTNPPLSRCICGAMVRVLTVTLREKWNHERHQKEVPVLRFDIQTHCRGQWDFSFTDEPQTEMKQSFSLLTMENINFMFCLILLWKYEYMVYTRKYEYITIYKIVNYLSQIWTP